MTWTRTLILVNKYRDWWKKLKEEKRDWVQSPIKLHLKRVKRNHCIICSSMHHLDCWCWHSILKKSMLDWARALTRSLRILTWTHPCTSSWFARGDKNAARTQCRMRGLKLHPKMAKRHRCILLRVAPPRLLCSSQNCFELGKLATTWHLWLLQIHFK